MTSFVDNAIDLQWLFFKYGVWDEVPKGTTLIFGDTQVSSQHSVGSVEGSLLTKSQVDSSSRFDTIPACDGRTDEQTVRWTHDDSIYPVPD